MSTGATSLRRILRAVDDAAALSTSLRVAAVTGPYRAASLPVFLGGRVATANEPGSTHPASPLALIRRHEPRDSPNCTREPGPIDATMRPPLLASARTTTQLVEIELTQRDDVRDLDDAVLEGLADGI